MNAIDKWKYIQSLTYEWHACLLCKKNIGLFDYYWKRKTGGQTACADCINTFSDNSMFDVAEEVIYNAHLWVQKTFNAHLCKRLLKGINE